MILLLFIDFGTNNHLLCICMHARFIIRTQNDSNRLSVEHDVSGKYTNLLCRPLQKMS